MLDKFIVNNNLSNENIGHSKTFERRGTKTCSIDVTLTKGLRQTIQEWKVERGYTIWVRS